MLEDGSESAVLEALELILQGKVNVSLVSYAEDTKGWTYFHYVVARYLRMKEEDEERARLLIRALYRLALAGIDVNTRDAENRTPLIMASSNLDQNLMRHVIRLGEYLSWKADVHLA